MMTKDEALKMAIETLERLDMWLRVRDLGGLMPQEIKIIEACKDALTNEQPAQEPVAYIQANEVNYIKAMKEEGIKEWRTCLGMNHEAGDVALYTHPAPSWQGLSDDEIEKIYADTEPDSKLDTYYIVLSRAIEQELRNKNHV